MSSISAVIASITVLIVLMMSFAYLYLSERKKYILDWLLSITGLLLTYTARLFMIKTGMQGMIPSTVNFAFLIIAYWFVFKGTRSFCGKGTSPYHGIATAVLILFYAALMFFRYPATPALVAACFYSILTLGFAGYTCLSAPTLNNPIKYISGFAFLLWAVATLTYPLARMLPLLPLRIGYAIIGSAGLITLLSMQAAYFLGVREKMQTNEEKIKRLAMFDKLTGVYNRNYFEEITDTFFDRFPLPVVLAMGDINGLKLINDTFGHKKGDELLVSAVKIMQQSLPEEYVIARWGGDEFILIMPGSTMEEAERTVARIQANCKSFPSNTIPIGISIGLAVAENRECSVDDLLAQAEERMYRCKLNESKQTRSDIMDFLQKLLWEKDYQTEEHVLRLQGLASLIGKGIGLSPKEIIELEQVALLHDIGKIAVPAGILNKPGPLTKPEWEIMKKHSETGYRIAQSSHELAHVSEAVLGHHEWWNGGGYPQALKGTEIPLYSRIVTIVDSFDVITHDRPYKKAMGIPEALDEIERCSGKQYDPHLAEVFVNLMKEAG